MLVAARLMLSKYLKNAPAFRQEHFFVLVEYHTFTSD